MNLSRPSLVSRLLLWYGAFGGPVAWALLHPLGIGFDLWQCNAGGRVYSLDVDTWTIALTAVLATVAALSIPAAVVMFFATRGSGTAPPLGRMHFTAAMSLVIGPLFLFLILMAGLGAISLPTCTQS